MNLSLIFVVGVKPAPNFHRFILLAHIAIKIDDIDTDEIPSDEFEYL